MTVLLLALVLDLIVGEPPNRWHPVAWAGGTLAAGRRALAGAARPALVLGGALLVLIVAALAAGAVLLAERLLEPWPLARVVVDACLLKAALSVRALFEAVLRVRAALTRGDLPGARASLGADLVSRPTDQLSAELAGSAAVESLAENLTDSLIAPLLFFAVGGVAAAWAYRVVNTADAMIGYRAGELEYLGKAAARLDDALNWVPARLGAWAIVAGAAIAGGSARGAWRALGRDAGRTASPNAGRTMAAMAGALGVTLTKPGHYTLGEGMAPDPPTIGRACRIAAAALAVVIVLALPVVRVLR
ncbi:MAG TPA: adenosylcobinamide-phosphate synthase CbiB [Verrucomicrobiae bacterium]|jgi:adenosylcobinamide-phosphate synthase|nr:adenosylcobinamide-phosphate synthase CbiB [Verrucomicrobiae bacterium]